ncbi:MAG: CRISPR-associated endonuclease Cas1 [Bacteroidia bacterium]|nr:MAG: CRISPR-associated endonuclease Cas1 [Bacteroidia bacterium]
MKKVLYLTQSGRLFRRQHTLCWQATQSAEARFLPIETLGEIYALGPVRLSTTVLRFLGEKRIPFHVFSYYLHYRGTFLPKGYIVSGQVRLRQARHALDRKKRLEIARRFVLGAIGGMQRNLAYYLNRGKGVEPALTELSAWEKEVRAASTLQAVMGCEGSARRAYYGAFGAILTGWSWAGRTKRPPTDPVNALLSFLNSLTYAAVLGQLYHTPLDPVIGFLHAPGRGRFPLALDLAEIFKPLLADRLLFRLLNRQEITATDFDPLVQGLRLRPEALRKVLQAWEAKLSETFYHRTLQRQVSYRYLIRLEAYKLMKHLLEIASYEPFRPWW